METTALLAFRTAFSLGDDVRGFSRYPHRIQRLRHVFFEKMYVLVFLRVFAGFVHVLVKICANMFLVLSFRLFRS